MKTIKDSGQYEFQVLLDQAQGKRSLRQFAEELGINVSTLSRIRTGTIKPNDTLLGKIVELSEIPGSVTFDQLKSTFVSMDEENRRSDKIRSSRIQQERNLQTVITMGLLTKGYSIEGFSEGSKLEFLKGITRVDLIVETNALNKEKGDVKTWAFDFIGLNLTGRADRTPINVMRIVDRIKTVAAAYYFDTMRFNRFSIVTNDEESFNAVRNRFSDLPICDEISIILVDILKKQIVEEFVLPKRDGSPSVLPFDVNKKE